MLIKKSPIAFMAVKMSLPIILGLIFWRIRNRSRKLVSYGLVVVLIVYVVVMQHFSLYHSQTIDFPDIIADFKSVSNSEFFQAFAGPHLLLKSEGKRGWNEKKLLWKIGKIYEGCLPIFS